MKRSVLLVLILLLIAPLSHSQLWKMRRWEVMGGIGPSFFFGDIGGYSQTKNLLGFRDLSYLQTRYDLNGNIKYRLSRDFNARLSLTYGNLHATDVRGSNEGRDYEASTSIFEPSLLAEYYFIKNRAESSYLFLKGNYNFIPGLLRSLDLYAFTGIGGVAYSVKGNDALMIDPGFVKNGFDLTLPLGVGATLIYSPNINFGLELAGRYAFTDFIDGYTSQYSKANDVYYFLNFTVTYKLKTGPKGWPSFR